MLTNVNKCNEKTTTETINQRQLRMRNKFFPKNQKNSKKIYKKILALQREKRDVVVVYLML